MTILVFGLLYLAFSDDLLSISIELFVVPIIFHIFLSITCGGSVGYVYVYCKETERRKLRKWTKAKFEWGAQAAAAVAQAKAGEKTLEYSPHQLHGIRFVSICRRRYDTSHAGVFNNLLWHSCVTRERERRYLFDIEYSWENGLLTHSFTFWFGVLCFMLFIHFSFISFK